MELEKQVCSLDLAKRLKELGMKQESLFYYYNLANTETGIDYRLGYWHGKILAEKIPSAKEDLISAFTVAELGELLPDGVASYKYAEDELTEWTCIRYITGNHSKYEHIEMKETEADARAKMLVYLIEKLLVAL